MYVILDKSLLEKQLINRAVAEQELERLNKLPSEVPTDHAIFVQVCNMDPNVLENLYALAALLLEKAKLDVLRAELTFPKLDGTMENISIASVMHQARLFLDQTEVQA